LLDFCLAHDKRKPLRLLCLGAHSDDIEIGSGGTILNLIKQDYNLDVCWVVFGSKGIRAREAKHSAAQLLTGVRKKKILIRNFRDGHFPFQGTEIKLLFEQIKHAYTPDLVLTHYRDDRHQDHRLISDLTWNTFRNHAILEYEVPKYDGDLGIPNFFVQLDASLCKEKVHHILDNFASQKQKHWFTEDTFLSMLRIRGIESCSPSKYAEAFYCRKGVLR
jgi:LmbE family N-acetylglucosaminyl deacetylase